MQSFSWWGKCPPERLFRLARLCAPFAQYAADVRLFRMVRLCAPFAQYAAIFLMRRMQVCLEIPSVPSPVVGGAVFDVDSVCGNAEFVIEDVADVGGEGVKRAGVFLTVDFDVDEGGVGVLVSFEENGCLVVEDDHEPGFGFSGDGRDGFSKACLDVGFVLIGEGL